MEGSIKSEARLEVSVSFGRFEKDELSWEKFSSFSPNKYLEEVGTLSTPGSVAQKKAYFEAHYKKIAAKKAEESEHDQRFMHPIIPISNMLSPEEPVNARNPPVNEEVAENESPNMHLSEEVTPGSCVTSLSTVTNCDDDDAEVDTGDSFSRVEKISSVNALTDEIVSDKQRETTDVVTAMESMVEVEEAIADPKSKIVKELVFDTMENRQKASKKVMVRSSPPERKKMGVERGSAALNKQRTIMNSQSIAQKVTPIKKERDSAAAKRKVITPSSKLLPAVTPRQSKSASLISVTPTSTTRPLKKKVNSSSLPTSKKPLVGESEKKVAPTSLHMSLSLGSPNSSSGTSYVTRKSLIMEKMGDKDIVKRAFKAFQNHRMIMDEKPVTVLLTASQTKLATHTSPPGKGHNKGLRKDAQKLATPKSQSVNRSSLYPPASRNWKDLTAISPAASVGLKNDDKAEKRKEFLKKLEARSKARVAENARTHEESKEGKV